VTLDEIMALEPRLAQLCEKYGIAELSVFGSVARGEDRPDSDIDLLYVRVPGNDLGMSYFALQRTWKSCSAGLLTWSPRRAAPGYPGSGHR
jgi:predicted nucleotidyltransferase